MRFLMVIVLAPLFAAGACADDWPQWMGPNRDNVWRENGILDKFPPGGPKIVWRAPVAGGYAGPAVATGKVYVSDFATPAPTEKEERLKRIQSDGVESFRAFDAATGKQLWAHSFPLTYAINYPAGPRCTPVVSGGKVYFLGAEGHLLCCDAAGGAIVWQKELKEEYKTDSPLWGFSAHPLIEGQTLITLAGGNGSHVVALHKDTGKEIWRSQTQPETGYSPPSIITVNGVRQLIIWGPKALRGLDPATGERLWTTPYAAGTSPIVMTPIQIGDYLFVGGPDNQNLLIKTPPGKAEAVEVVWKNKREREDGLCPQTVQPIAEGNLIYGINGDGRMNAIEIPSGERLWESDVPLKKGVPFSRGTVFLVKNADRFVLFNELGEIVLCKLSRTAYEEIDRAKVIEPTNRAFGRKVVWCMPAFANKRCYVRNDKELICVEMAK
jgi:outer membrane protein assembly factor BamB